MMSVEDMLAGPVKRKRGCGYDDDEEQLANPMPIRPGTQEDQESNITFVDGKSPPVTQYSPRRAPKKPRTHVVKHTDGFGWLKYGQKIVKRSNCHRSYYRCSEAGCSAKKTVEQELVPRS